MIRLGFLLLTNGNNALPLSTCS